VFSVDGWPVSGFFIAISRVKQYNDIQFRGINMRNGGQGRPILKVEGMKYLTRQGGAEAFLPTDYYPIRTFPIPNLAVIKYFSSNLERAEL